MKYRDIVRDTISRLMALGLEPVFPNLGYNKDNPGDANTIEEMRRLAYDHYEAIDEADIVYFITPDGYMGTSCKLELGYAVAKKKRVYFSEPTKDIGLDCYVTKFIPLNDLQLFLKQNTIY